MHHGAAVLDLVLLGVVDQRVLVAGRLHGVVTLLQLESNSIRLGMFPVRNWIIKCNEMYLQRG